MRSVFRSLPAEDQTWEELMSRYIQKEDEKDRQEQADKSAVQGQAAALHLKRGSGGNGGKGGAGGKKDGQDKGKKGDWKARATCFRCNQRGHVKSDCPDKHKSGGGGGTDKGQANVAQSEPAGDFFGSGYAVMDLGSANVSIDSSLVAHASALSAYDGLVDGGATAHITPFRHILTGIRRLDKPRFFRTAGSGVIKCEEVGKARLPSVTGHMAVIEECHYIPGASLTLISENLLRKVYGWHINHDEMTNRKGGVTVKMYNRGGDKLLSYVGIAGERPGILAPAVGYREDGEAPPILQEHLRLGHAGKGTLLKLAKDGRLRWSHAELSESSWTTEHCTVCQQHKIPRHGKNGQSPRGTRPAELVVMDFIGPYAESVEGNKFCLLIKDDYSKALGVFPMPDRASYHRAFAHFVIKLERQFGEKVRFVRSDGAPEFVSEKAEAWFTSMGIIHQTTPRYTPEFNGVAERHVRTIKEMAAAMLATSGLGHGYWDYALKYAGMVLMKINFGEDGVSAYERLTGRDSGIESIRQFGEYCFAHIPQETRFKSDMEIPKAELGRFVGMDEGASGWMVRLETTGKVVRSRDVRSALGHPLIPPPLVSRPAPLPSGIRPVPLPAVTRPLVTPATGTRPILTGISGLPPVIQPSSTVHNSTNLYTGRGGTRERGSWNRGSAEGCRWRE